MYQSKPERTIIDRVEVKYHTNGILHGLIHFGWWKAQTWCQLLVINVVHAHKEVLLFATPLLSQIPLQGIEHYLGFWSGRFFLSWWLVGAVCWPLLNHLSVVSRRERLV
jgi:hypothetical protein